MEYGIMASARQEAANAKARALGFKNAYDRRIQTALSKGKSRKEARGNHPKETGTRKKFIPPIEKTPQEKVRDAVKNAVATTIHLVGDQNNGKHGVRKNRKIDLGLNQQESAIYHGLKAAGKDHAALVYALANIYGVPEMTAGTYFEDDMPYDDYLDIDDNDYDFADADYGFKEA